STFPKASSTQSASDMALVNKTKTRARRKAKDLSRWAGFTRAISFSAPMFICKKSKSVYWTLVQYTILILLLEKRELLRRSLPGSYLASWKDVFVNKSVNAMRQYAYGRQFVCLRVISFRRDFFDSRNVHAIRGNDCNLQRPAARCSCASGPIAYGPKGPSISHASYSKTRAMPASK